MTLQNLARSVAVVLALVWAIAAPAGAQPTDLWTVTNVPVDATGASPSAAKDAALAQGRQKAWTEVFRRLTPSGEWSRQPPITDEDLEKAVKSFDIAAEKHSSTRYLATVTYVFNAGGVRAALKKTGTPFSESVAKPMLVVPLAGTAWAPDSAWGKAWAQQAMRGRLVPVVVPKGDADDMGALATISSASDWPMVKSLADRYGASGVLVASAGKSGKGMQVSVAQIRPEGRTQRSQPFAPQGAEDESALALRASGWVAEGLQEEWKRTTSVDYGQSATVSVAVSFRGLAEWVAIRRSLAQTKVVQTIAVEELNMTSAKVRLDYVGRVEQLQTSLSQTNLFLTSDTTGNNWTLSRNAAAAPPG